jgi:hypothetical protein
MMHKGGRARSRDASVTEKAVRGGSRGYTASQTKGSGKENSCGGKKYQAFSHSIDEIGIRQGSNS